MKCVDLLVDDYWIMYLVHYDTHSPSKSTHSPSKSTHTFFTQGSFHVKSSNQVSPPSPNLFIFGTEIVFYEKVAHAKFHLTPPITFDFVEF